MLRACVVLLVSIAISTAAARGSSAQGTRQEPASQLRLPVTRDTWVSAAPSEQECNLGGATRLKTKGIQEFALVDLDPRALRGRIIERATLHLHVASTDVQRRVSVSTIASEWVEGNATSYEKQRGSACFRSPALGLRAWSTEGSDITSVILGNGNTLWRFADATAPDDRGWQTVAVDPDVVAARVAGLSYGMLVFDDVGSEYERKGDAFEYRMFLNRFVHSREEGERRAPYFTVQLGAEDREAPDAPDSNGAIEIDTRGLPAGEARVSWATPQDHGRAGTIGFFVEIAVDGDWTKAREVPRSLIPLAGLPGARVRMHLRDLGLAAEANIGLRMRAVDRAGNLSEATTVASVRVSRGPTAIVLEPEAESAPEVSAEPVRFGGASVTVIDALDKLAPETGELIPPHPPAYRQSNHLWSSAARTVRLQAARNECVEFQLVLTGAASPIDARLTFDEPSLHARFFECRGVASKSGVLPDALVPLGETNASLATTAQHASTLIEIQVPHAIAAGTHKGKLVLSAGGERLELAVELRVWDFTLPDHLSFLTEMNCYELPAAPRDRDYYRLAHEHRTCLNRLGYNWQGRVHAGCAPKWDAESVDWKEYDEHYGALLDGSAFADLPRAGVPLDVFYLPLNENWPIPIEPAFQGGYWADEALDPRYLQAFSDACGRFAAHLDERGWHDTLFEFYLNNKVFFKDTSWSRCSAPWVFDEPMNTQDFWALRVFGKAFHSGIAGRRGATRMAFRCDISRPQWQRDTLDGLLDVEVVGNALRQHTQLVNERKQRNGVLTINYSSPNPIESSNAHAVAWALDAWCLGCDGIVPWQTIGTDASWKNADALALFYPGEAIGKTGPLPSLRLKAYRRAQQDVEYLVQFLQATASERAAVVALVRAALPFAVVDEQRFTEDAGTLSFTAIEPQRLWSLRHRIGARLDALHPPPLRKRVEFTSLTRDVSKLPSIGPVLEGVR